MTERRNGEAGTGPFTFDARKKILDRLLATQAKAGMPLITPEEITRIEEIWAVDAVTSANRLFDEYRKITERANEEHSSTV